jgi:hypothetical protein
MGLFTALVTLPLAPVRGTVWIAERLLEEAEREQNDPAVIDRQLVDAEAAWERGELSDEEYGRIEEDLVSRLIGQETWHG